MNAYRAIGIGAFVAAGMILAAFAVFGLTLNTTPSYPRGLWRQVGVAEPPVIRGRMALACPPPAPAFDEAVRRGYMGGPGWVFRRSRPGVPI
jgi:type IV secretory pathway protease TraF